MQKKEKKFTLTQPTKIQITQEVGHCEKCNEKENLEVHHIKKVRDGGKHTLNNLMVLCHNCHKNKAHRGPFSATEQRKRIHKRTKKLQHAITVILDKAKKRKKIIKHPTPKTHKPGRITHPDPLRDYPDYEKKTREALKNLFPKR